MNTGASVSEPYRPPGKRAGPAGSSGGSTTLDSRLGSKSAHYVGPLGYAKETFSGKKEFSDFVGQLKVLVDTNDQSSSAKIDSVLGAIGALQLPHKTPSVTQEMEELFRIISSAVDYNYSKVGTEELCRVLVKGVKRQQISSFGQLVEGLVSIILQYLIEQRSGGTDWNSILIVFSALRDMLESQQQAARYGVWIIKILLLYLNCKIPEIEESGGDIKVSDVQLAFISCQVEIARVLGLLLGYQTRHDVNGSEESAASTAAGESKQSPSREKKSCPRGRPSSSEGSETELTEMLVLDEDMDPVGAFLREGRTAVDTGSGNFHWKGFKAAITFDLRFDVGVDISPDDGLNDQLLLEAVDGIMMRCAEICVKQLHAVIHVYTKIATITATIEPYRTLIINWTSALMGAIKMGITFDRFHSSALASRPLSSIAKPYLIRPTTLLFTPHLPSLVIALRTAFQRIIPGFLTDIEEMESKDSNAEMTLSHSSIKLDASFVAEVGFVCSAHFLLGSLASSNPGDFIRNWPLFLTDSFGIDSNLTKYLQYLQPLRHELVEDKVVNVATSIPRPPTFVSPVYRAFLLGVVTSRGHEWRNSIDVGNVRSCMAIIRCTVSQTLRAFLINLPVRKWLLQRSAVSDRNRARTTILSASVQSQKVIESIIKMIEVLNLAMLYENDEQTLANNYEIVRVLLSELPLATLYIMDNRGHVKPGRESVNIKLENVIGRLITCVFKMSVLGDNMFAASGKTGPSSAKMHIQLLKELEPSPINSSLMNFLNTIGTRSILWDINKTVTANFKESGGRHKGALRYRCIQAVLFLTELGCDISAPLNVLCDAVQQLEYRLVDGHNSDESYATRLLNICVTICGMIGPQKGSPDALASFGLSLKTLIVSLFQSIGCKFIKVTDPAFVSFISIAKVSPSISLRMLTFQCIGMILNACNMFEDHDEYDARRTEIQTVHPSRKCEEETTKNFTWNLFETSGPVFLIDGVATSLDNFYKNPKNQAISIAELTSLLSVLCYGCSDSDHQVRGHAASSIGLIGSNIWMFCKRGASTSGDCGIDALLKQLLLLCQDSVGTVRTLAHKSLGEVVVAGGLRMGRELGEVNSKEGRAQGLVELILVRIRAGCCDSKLAVRMQAAWSLGNILMLLLPYRLIVSAAPDVPSPHFPNYLQDRGLVHRDIVRESAWADSEIWKTLSVLCTEMLKDSEKLVFSVIRCLGLLAVGLVHDAYESANLLNIIINCILCGKELYTLSSEDIVVPNEEEFRLVMRSQTQKMLMAVATASGLIGWAVAPLIEASIPSARLMRISCINCVITVLCELIKHSVDNVKLQAARGLILLAYSDVSAPSQYFSEDLFGSGIRRRIMETVLAGIAEVRISSSARREKLKVKRLSRPVSKEDNRIEGSPSGKKLIITKPAPVRGALFLVSSSEKGSTQLPLTPVESGHSGPKGITPKIFKPLPSAITSAITIRRLPVAESNDFSLIRAYIILLWTITANESNKSIPDSTSSPEKKFTIEKSDELTAGFTEIVLPRLESVVDRMELLMDDTEAISESFFQLTASPILGVPSAVHHRIFKGYTVAANTLAADVARYFLRLMHDLDAKYSTLSHKLILEKLSWLAAADVKYFIIPGEFAEQVIVPVEEQKMTETSCKGHVDHKDGTIEGSFRTDYGKEVQEQPDSSSEVVFIKSRDLQEAYLYDEDEI